MGQVCALLNSVVVDTPSKEQTLYNLAEKATSVILEQSPLFPVGAEHIVRGIVLRYMRQAANIEGA